MLLFKRGGTSLGYMSEDMRLPSSAKSASSGSPRRRVLWPIGNAGSRADSRGEATTCNERRAALPGHADAICVPKGAAAFHDNPSVLGPRDFKVAMMCGAGCRSGSLLSGRSVHDACGLGNWTYIDGKGTPGKTCLTYFHENKSPNLERLVQMTPPQTAAGRTT